MNAALFEPLKVRGIEIPNRLALSPMCQYLAVGGLGNEGHFANLTRFVLGGFGLVIVEAAAVNPQGRVTYGDLGIWKDEHIEPLRSITAFAKKYGAVPALQIGHGGRKSSVHKPWDGHDPLAEKSDERPWETFSASALPVGDGWPVPTAMSQDAMEAEIRDWVAAAGRAKAAGFEMLEVHAAHGYLLNSFLSPISNARNDEFGGDIEGRMKFPLQVIEAVRAAWPDEKPLSVRISAVDGVEGGWTIEDSVIFARELKHIGVDFVDCSSGGIGGAVAGLRIPRSFGFQIPFAEKIKKEADIATIAVGLIVEAEMANDIVSEGRADIVAIGRQALVEPNWPHLAHSQLTGRKSWERWPPQTGWWLERRDASIAASKTSR